MSHLCFGLAILAVIFVIIAIIGFVHDWSQPKISVWVWGLFIISIILIIAALAVCRHGHHEMEHHIL